MEKEKIYLWGTGIIARRVLQSVEIDNNYNVLGIIDNNSDKWGTYFLSYKIYSPDVLTTSNFDAVAVLNDSYLDINMQIETMLKKRVQVWNKNYFYQQKILERYNEAKDLEIQRVIQYIEENGLDIFNYSYVNMYKDKNISIYLDSGSGLYYVVHKGKKMFMKRSFETINDVKNYYYSLLIEQDQESPHHYLDDKFELPQRAIVADVGAAEGIFTLDNIEKIEKAYVFECDEEWVEALEKTFEPYEKKVTIIQKYVGDYVDERSIRLDEYKKCGINFIKMDIEGAECIALEGAKEIIGDSKNMECAICAYHAEYDEQAIRWMLSEYGMETSTTDGYMWFPYDIKNKKVSTKLVRGIVRGVKNR